MFLVTQAGRGREPPLRIRIDRLDEVKLSRSAARRFELHTGGRRRLELGVADSWMSLDHAALVCDGPNWRLVDHRSKNGTKINGRLEHEAVLHDGDLLEMGRTFFVFRQLATPIGAPRSFEAGKLSALTGLATLIPELAERFDELARLAASKTSIVIRGPTGSGKELLARAVHTLSGRRGAFIAVNCAGLPESLVEAELFGNVRGAFTGALSDRQGLVAAAAGGTLFLDEIGDLPRSTQSKLLRALQEQAVRPVGGTLEVPIDLRVVAATHHDLDQLVADGSFRNDLLARLGGCFDLPPLCARREDLGVIIDAVLARIDDPRACGAGLSSDAVRALLSYPWPRNIRELQKALERAIALAGTDTIELAHLPPELRQPPPLLASRPPHTTLSDDEQAQRDQLVELLRVHRGNVAAVARELGTVRSQIQRWIRRYDIPRDKFA